MKGLDVLEMLFSPKGRIRRSDYWGWSIGVIVLALIILGIAALATRAGIGGQSNLEPSPVYVLVYLIVGVAVMWASICLQIKRWHDRDKSWPWIFITLIPLIGPIWVLVECGFEDGTQGPNRFGPSPKVLGNKATAKV
jgi:uncharacterized membrane protein YhaH (DUF805 family)